MKKRAKRERVERGERSQQLNCVYMYVKVIFITEKWSGQELLRRKFTESISTISLFWNISILSVNTTLGNNLSVRSK